VPFTIWFTGLPGAGKTTLATRLGEVLREHQGKVEVLDSDTVGGMLKDVLGCEARDRDLLARSMGMICAYLNLHGVICLACATTPRSRIRHRNRRLIQGYIEVFCSCSLEEAERRDPKHLYALARAGVIKNFTGVDEPYEIPEAPEIKVNTDRETVEESLMRILSYLEGLGFLPKKQDQIEA